VFKTFTTIFKHSL